MKKIIILLFLTAMATYFLGTALYLNILYIFKIKPSYLFHILSMVIVLIPLYIYKNKIIYVLNYSLNKKKRKKEKKKQDKENLEEDSKDYIENIDKSNENIIDVDVIEINNKQVVG